MGLSAPRPWPRPGQVLEARGGWAEREEEERKGGLVWPAWGALALCLLDGSAEAAWRDSQGSEAGLP